MENNTLFEAVKELNLPLGEYVLFGSAPMGIRGLRECNDVDMLVSEKLWDDLVDRDWQEKTLSDGFVCLIKDDIEAWRTWRPGVWDTKQLIKEADIINDLPFVKLEYVLAWKKLNGREKDRKDIVLLENFLKTNK